MVFEFEESGKCLLSARLRLAEKGLLSLALMGHPENLKTLLAFCKEISELSKADGKEWTWRWKRALARCLTTRTCAKPGCMGSQNLRNFRKRLESLSDNEEERIAIVNKIVKNFRKGFCL